MNAFGKALGYAAIGASLVVFVDICFIIPRGFAIAYIIPIPYLFFGIFLVAYIANKRAGSERIVTDPKTGTQRLVQSTRIQPTNNRLTYRRYKQLQPEHTIDYSQYKRLQMGEAFRRAVPSETIERLVSTE